MNFVHIYSEYLVRDEDEQRRNTAAMRTWTLPNLIPCPINDTEIKTKKINGKDWPTLKGIIDCALAKHIDAQYFCFSNNDIGFIAEDFTKPVEYWFTRRIPTQQAYSYTAKLIPYAICAALNKDEIDIFQERLHGHDVFFFHRQWWKTVRKHLNGFVVGYPLWDTLMYYLTVTNDLSADVRRELFDVGIYNKAEFNSNEYCYTEHHFPDWQKPEKVTDAVTKNNERLLKRFFKEEKKALFPEDWERLRIMKIF
jgi:hypothetical protein